MTTIDISSTNPLVGHLMSILRDKNEQKNREMFRFTVKRLGFMLAEEAAKHLEYVPSSIVTPFGACEMNRIASDLVLYAILRAGEKLQEGVSEVFSNSDCGFCSCMKDEYGIRHAQVIKQLNIEGKVLVISDPIMTSGDSMIKAINSICINGKPLKIIVLNLISTPLAISNLSGLNDNITVITCAIDQYTKGVRGTIPGLGDVGDLLYGKY